MFSIITDKSCKDFLEVLASDAPAPGGGGAAALVGAMGVALGSMVGNLTLGKKKYEDVQDDIKKILKKSEILCDEIAALVERDLEVFEPLSKAYGLPRNTDDEKRTRAEVMEKALILACSVPFEIMQRALEAIDIHEELALKGTRIAISDVGVGVLFCKSALLGASLNIFINTKMMKDRAYAKDMDIRTEVMIEEGTSKADRIYRQVEALIK